MFVDKVLLGSGQNCEYILTEDVFYELPLDKIICRTYAIPVYALTGLSVAEFISVVIRSRTKSIVSCEIP